MKIKILSAEELACEMNRTLSYIPESVRNETMSTFRMDTELREKVHAAVAGYLADFKSLRMRSLVLYGPKESGKTHLSAALFREIAPLLPDREQDMCDSLKNYAWISAGDLKTSLTEKIGNKENASKVPGKEFLMTAQFAVIDDIDKYPGGQWASDLFNLLDARLLVNKLPTIVSMNLTPAQFCRKYGQYGPLMLSRFQRTGSLFIRTT